MTSIDTVAAPTGVTLPEQTPTAAAMFASNALFAGIPPVVIEKICQQIELVTFAAEEMVFAEDDTGECLYLIARGAVRISKRGPNNQQEVLAVLQPNDYFGEMALVDNEKRSAQASAAEEMAVLGRMNRETWDLLLRFAPHEVMANFTRSMMFRLRQNNQRFVEQIAAITAAFASSV